MKASATRERALESWALLEEGECGNEMHSGYNTASSVLMATYLRIYVVAALRLLDTYLWE